MKPILLFTLLSLAIASLHAQSITLSTNLQSGVYERGERISITATSSDIGSDPIQVKVWKNNIELILDTSIPNSSDGFSVFEKTFNEPCSLIIEVSSGETKTSIGALVDPTNFKPGSKRPKDFDRYWNKQKKLLAKLPFETKMDPLDLPEGTDDFDAFSVEINCVGPQPARGYLAKPKGAEPKSLPIVLVVRAAGVKGSWCRSNLNQTLRYAKMGGGALSFDLNAHGMLNGQSEEYYKELEDGELNRYWDLGVESRETYYFRAMYLRMLRSIEFLTQQPEWDGKRILVIGESQGGGQALAAAGLDSRVSAVVATVPAMCDFSGILAERKSGWPQPIESNGDSDEILNTVRYFDTAHMLRGSKATLVVEIGMIDTTCPSTSIYAAVNQSKGEKTLYPVPYRGHSWPTGTNREIWDKTVHAAKEAFVESYLK